MYFQIRCRSLQEKAMKLLTKLCLPLLQAVLSLCLPLPGGVSIVHVQLLSLKVRPGTKYLINKAGVFMFVAKEVENAVLDRKPRC